MKKDKSRAETWAEKASKLPKGSLAKAIEELKAEEAERMKGKPEAPPTIFPMYD